MSEFKALLAKAESLCDRFPSLIESYSINNAFGTLHFLMARNLRFIRTSLELMAQHKYSKSFSLLRSTMEGALILRYFTKNPSEIQTWHNLDLKIKAETDEKQRKILWRERQEKFGPKAIREKIAKGKLALAKDLFEVYNQLSELVHPPVIQEGDFLIHKNNGYEVTRTPKHDERQVKNWMNAAILFLTSTLKIFDTLHTKRFFARLGKPFAVELKQVAEETLRLLKERALL